MKPTTILIAATAVVTFSLVSAAPDCKGDAECMKMRQTFESCMDKVPADMQESMKEAMQKLHEGRPKPEGPRPSLEQIKAKMVEKNAEEIPKIVELMPGDKDAAKKAVTDFKDCILNALK